jgi:hydrogenase nickel incorporation protein HypB
MQIKIMQSVLAANDKKAAELRALLAAKKIFMVNLISSPGSGKTTLLEKTMPLLAARRLRAAVIEGDIATDKDAKRLEQFNIPIALINTEGACHLESVSIEKALQSFDLDKLDIIFVENVGNLVCPAEFDVGEDLKVAMLSTPEGTDKVSKYPLLFHEAALIMLNKIDLLEYLDFQKQTFYNDAALLNPNAPIFELSTAKDVGLDKWVDWLEERISQKQQMRNAL